MLRFVDTEELKRKIEDIIELSKQHEAETISEEERLVMNQKTLLYKFYCKVWYGHLFKNGKCLRCGQVLVK